MKASSYEGLKCTPCLTASEERTAAGFLKRAAPSVMIREELCWTRQESSQLLKLELAEILVIKVGLTIRWNIKTRISLAFVSIKDNCSASYKANKHPLNPLMVPTKKKEHRLEIDE